jgi:hypothetical protein
VPGDKLDMGDDAVDEDFWGFRDFLDIVDSVKDSNDDDDAVDDDARRFVVFLDFMRDVRCFSMSISRIFCKSAASSSLRIALYP